MKMVSASKLRKTQNAMASLTAYADRAGRMLAGIRNRFKAEDNPLSRREGEVKSVCYVLILGNRGLCGIYNNNLLKYMCGIMKEETLPCRLIVCGKWGTDRVEAAGLEVFSHRELSDVPTAEEAQQLCDELLDMYLKGEADRIEFVFQRFKSVLAQTPGTETLLPLPMPEEQDAADKKIIFEPDGLTVLKELSEIYFINKVHAVLLEARAGEHAARMTAMTTASDNTDELIEELNLKMNHARQAAITTEISEIVGASAAFREN